uniref:Fluoride ion transporter CrcB n=1 Tax=Craspedostauros australis TaxID=1486917 RepID=A0A7R9ZJY4_9STRA
MSYSMLLAPLGAISRWQLSKLNGKLVAFPWFPAGTFAANILGSIVSILTVALEYRLEVQYGDFDFWTVGSIRAVRIGLAGCLTTVSTFVSEIVKFLKSNTNHAYPYMYWTLGTAAAISAFIYGLAVYSM